MLKDLFKQDDKLSENKVNELYNRLEKLHLRKTTLTNKLLDNEIDSSEYKEIKMKLQNEEQEINFEITGFKNQKTSLEKYFNFGLPFLFDLAGNYKKADVHIKGKIVGSIFPEKLVFSENKYRTAKTNSLLELLTNNINSLGGYKKRKADISVGLSSMALPSGLEPETL